VAARATPIDAPARIRESLRALAAKPWRVVEAQHVVATRKLVDSAEEHEVLERLLESGKPPLPRELEFTGLHFLLTTPFRYPPLAHGSRFATRAERSPWYGSRHLATAFAEVAYYRLAFLEGTRAELGRLEVEVSVFRTPVRTRRGLDLLRAPFAALADRISSPARYEDAQALGRAMRAEGVEACRYRSARDPGRGANLALFTPKAFAAKRPEAPQTWLCSATRDAVELVRKDYFEKGAFRFERAVFEVAGKLPQPTR
jgi:hypothetical protein